MQPHWKRSRSGSLPWVYARKPVRKAVPHWNKEAVLQLIRHHVEREEAEWQTAPSRCGCSSVARCRRGREGLCTWFYGVIACTWRNKVRPPSVEDIGTLLWLFFQKHAEHSKHSCSLWWYCDVLDYYSWFCSESLWYLELDEWIINTASPRQNGIKQSLWGTRRVSE